ncbi:RidA family protein [Spirosoma taeanense]|uniref:RidA family protein n=1 Tax=Spirosoma taeanense TaxID=2735870 RepID=A0A6M5YC18_9BACT|nr:RidA family protein [Spirosoma taeanense]QJW90823.1 RidA family protein [Spirosoma taeanense]
MKKAFTVLTLVLLTFLNRSNGQAVEQKLTSMGLALFPPTKAMANYVKAVRTGNLVFLAGHVSSRADGSGITGKLGKDLTVEQGYEAARITTVSLLSTLKAELGNLDRVRRIVKVTGFVNSTPDFGDQPKVVNGCSDLLVALFGEKGKHARSAVGMAALPSNYAVEIELVVEVE